jgi:ribosomal protein S27E
MKTIECVDCGESVPYGRLSCPACGALLASVAGGRARVLPVSPVSAPEVVSFEALDPLPIPEPASVATLARIARPARAAAPIVEAFFTEPLDETPSFWPPLADVPEPILAARPYRTPAWATIPLEATPEAAPQVAPLPPTWATIALAPEPPSPRVATPGAYRPPAFSLATAGPGLVPSTWSNASGAGGASVARMAGSVTKAPAIAFDAARFREIAVWFVVVGSTLSVLGFFLPWSRVVIGAASYGDYFDAWGLASPTHWLVLAGLLLVLALGIVHTIVPIWLRTGVLGLGLGALLVGLVWPYVAGPLGADVGVLCVGLGGLTMVAGGALASWATRHVEVDPAV